MENHSIFTILKNIFTKVWLAKRMKMIEHFGYKIAYTPNDKSNRASYKYAKNDCEIFD